MNSHQTLVLLILQFYLAFLLGYFFAPVLLLRSLRTKSPHSYWTGQAARKAHQKQRQRPATICHQVSRQKVAAQVFDTFGAVDSVAAAAGRAASRDVRRSAQRQQALSWGQAEAAASCPHRTRARKGLRSLCLLPSSVLLLRLSLPPPLKRIQCAVLFRHPRAPAPVRHAGRTTG